MYLDGRERKGCATLSRQLFPVFPHAEAEAEADADADATSYRLPCHALLVRRAKQYAVILGQICMHGRTDASYHNDRPHELSYLLFRLENFPSIFLSPIAMQFCGRRLGIVAWLRPTVNPR